MGSKRLRSWLKVKVQMSKTVEIDCAVSRVLSRDGRSVTVLAVKDGSDAPFTVRGPLGRVEQGESLRLSGRWKKTEGKWVFEASKARLPMARNGAAALEWLSSGAVAGIGPSLAKRIADKFGTQALSILEDNPKRLMEVDGIGKARLEMILEGLKKAPAGNLRSAAVELAAYGVRGETAKKLIAKYKTRTIDVLRKDPYVLTSDIYGIGFKKADGIAASMGFSATDPLRIASGLRYALGQMANLGHVYSDRESLAREGRKLLGLPDKEIEPVMAEMCKAKLLVEDGGRVYRKDMYRMECSVARDLACRASARCQDLSGKKTMRRVTGGVRAFLTGKARKYDPEQLEAIRSALSRSVSVLTGGPGTGKTLAVEGMLKGFEANGWKAMLAAPTGRAAKRLEECCGRRAQTLHRLLGIGLPKEGWDCNADVLIIDECSMVDLALMDKVLSLVPPEVRLVFVGDADQLPSVGPGSVLRDMLMSGVVPTVRLETVHRQSVKSLIAENAQKVNKGMLPDTANDAEGDFFFLPCADANSTAVLIADLVERRLPAAYPFDPEEIQVLTPMKKGAAGTIALNAALQSALNPPSPSKGEVLFGDLVFREGDKVMQTKNNYDMEVFNGDVGIVECACPEDGFLRVRYTDKDGGRTAVYSRQDLDQLIPAYACTIHKSQGSEFPAVVIPVLGEHHIMLQRNLIYTAITRAKKLCVLVGSLSALSYAVANDVAPRRNSMLRERLQREAAKRPKA